MKVKRKKFFYCILGFGVHVKNMQDYCIGTHMAVWFAAFLPITYIWHFSPCCLFSISTPTVPLLFPPDRPQCVVLPSLCPCVLIVQHPPVSENMCLFHFLFLCQFAENDVLQVHPCPYKGPELIVFDGCIIFHGVYVPHFPCPVHYKLLIFIRSIKLWLPWGATNFIYLILIYIMLKTTYSSSAMYVHGMNE